MSNEVVELTIWYEKMFTNAEDRLIKNECSTLTRILEPCPFVGLNPVVIFSGLSQDAPISECLFYNFETLFVRHFELSPP